jgi:toxin ParE1/3/4
VPHFELARAALADLEAIADYTIERWGNTQAGTYLDVLEALLTDLARRPLTGRKRNDLAPGLFSCPFESHVVFYARTPFGIRIVRILHQRQDAPRHLR